MLISFHPPIMGNLINSWDLIEILTEKYKHSVMPHFDPLFLGENDSFKSIPEIGYQYYLEVANGGLPDKILVLGNCFGSLSAWESARHFQKAGVKTFFCGINPARWLYPERRDISWAERYPSPLKEIACSYTRASESYAPSQSTIIPYFILGSGNQIPNEWLGLCPEHKKVSVPGIPHGLTQYRFGGSAYLTASLIDEYIKTK